MRSFFLILKEGREVRRKFGSNGAHWRKGEKRKKEKGSCLLLRRAEAWFWKMLSVGLATCLVVSSVNNGSQPSFFKCNTSGWSSLLQVTTATM